MSYETISVRMNRSDTTIRWGFLLSKSGDRLIIQNLEPESLSEKAGLRNGDFVESICGHPARSLGVPEANQIVDQARYEVFFTLQRYVTSHSCLPWTLSEKDNKLVVDEIRPGYGTGFTHNAFNQKSSSFGNPAPPAPAMNTSNYSSNQKYSSSVHSSSNNQSYNSGIPRTHEHNLQNSIHPTQNNFTSGSRYNTSNYTSGTAYPSPPVVAAPAPPAPSQFYNAQNDNRSGIFNSNAAVRNHSVKFVDDNSGSKKPTGYANGNVNSFGGTTPSKTDGSLPMNQQPFIQTSMPNTDGFSSRSKSSLSPGGSRVRYHSPSSRSRRDLSPNSSVEHLQYNSPMNIYSPDTVAEQYALQTGKALEGQRSQNNTPAYLNSETKKYIEEVEGRMHRGLSPSCQSSSFKRISQAVGAPCK